jgi:hypothetical protein
VDTVKRPVSDSLKVIADEREPKVKNVVAAMCITILAAIAVAATSKASFAQAGSTGGTIGKQDKSLSGGEDTPSPRRDTRPAKPASPAASLSPLREKETRCMAIVGTWTWYLGITETVFNQNGSMRNSNGVTGTWTCPRAPGSATWSNGPPATETYTMSQDGNSLSVVSAWGGGVRFTATRRSQN